VRIYQMSVLGLLVLLPRSASSQRPAPEITQANCVEDVQRAVGAFVGQWNVRLIVRTGPATRDTSAATATIAPELGGCILRESFHGTRSGEPFDVAALWGVNGATDRAPIQRASAHSQHGLLTLSEGRWSDAGDTLTLRDSAVVRGIWIQQQTVISRPQSGRFIIEGRRSEDGGRTWIVTQRLLYSRLH
jgi:hypothetical protein